MLCRWAMRQNPGANNFSLQRGARATRAASMKAASTSRPVILFDIMDTVVKDPFYEHMPAHFGLTFKELLAAKHPTKWMEFEKGQASEAELFEMFFQDGRAVDGDALKSMLVQRYEYLPGMQQLLLELKVAGYELHACSNYPAWWQLIEEKLEVSSYLAWTFISCEGPMQGYRKPDPAVYSIAAQALQRQSDELILVDDRLANVEGASSCGLRGIHFQGADDCRRQLMELGVVL